MGAWGINNFESDSAMEWVANFEENPSSSYIEETFAQADAEEYIEVDTGIAVLAAAEVLAAKKGNTSTGFPSHLLGLLFAIQVDESLTNSALKSIDNIVKKGSSELYDLWDESGKIEKWLTVINNLKAKLVSNT